MAPEVQKVGSLPGLQQSQSCEALCLLDRAAALEAQCGARPFFLQCWASPVLVEADGSQPVAAHYRINPSTSQSTESAACTQGIVGPVCGF